MIEIKKVMSLNDKDILVSILRNEKLFDEIDGQDESLSREDVMINTNLLYCLIQKEEKVIGCFSFKLITKTVVEGHIRILPEYRNNSLPEKALKAGMKFLNQETNFITCITIVPKNCYHVKNFLARTSFKKCGKITNGIIYNKQLTDLLIYQSEVRQ